MIAAILLLFAAGLFFILIDQGLLAGLCLIGSALAFIAHFLKASKEATESVAKGLTKGMAEQAGAADTGYPDKEVLEAGIKNAAGLAGQQMFAGRKKGKPFIGDQHQFKYKGFGTVVQNLISTFKKVFKW